MLMTLTNPRKSPQRNRRDLIITGILLIIFAVSFTKNVLMRKKPGPPPPPAASSANETQGMTDQLIIVTNIRVYDKLRQERVAMWDKEWGRDPFVPQQALATIVKAVNLTLKGVLWDDEHPKAIVNEKTLYVGDTVYGYTVVEIKPRSVVLKTGEKNIELQVFRPVIAEPAPAAS